MAASVEVGDDAQSVSHAVVIVLIWADGNGETFVENRQQLADAGINLHPAEADDVLNQQNGAGGVATIDEPVEAIPFPARVSHLDGVFEFELRVGCQPVVTGPLLSRQARPGLFRLGCC